MATNSIDTGLDTGHFSVLLQSITIQNLFYKQEVKIQNLLI